MQSGLVLKSLLCSLLGNTQHSSSRVPAARALPNSRLARIPSHRPILSLVTSHLRIQQSSSSSFWTTSPCSQSFVQLQATTMSNNQETTTNNNNNNDDENSMRLFDQWMRHDSFDFHSFSPNEAREIRQALLAWYAQNRRKLPWRGDPPPWDGSTVDFAANNNTNNKTKKSTTPPKQQKKISDFFQKPIKPESSSSSSDTTLSSSSSSTLPTFPVTPYGVWVSEIMLQQTRVEAVIPYWVRWMQSFPTIAHLAAATDEQVNAHFAGLGFYRRARLLHQACQKVVLTNGGDGILPDTASGLQKELPGVGRYTACAIASIAYGEKVAVVDGNVCRVLSRLRGVANQIKAPAMKDKYAWDLAQQLMDAGGDDDDDDFRPGDLNQALMELGATYCAPSGTGIDPGDPLVKFYQSTRLGYQYALSRSREDHNEDCLAITTTDLETKCPICAKDGVQQALERLDDLWQTRSETAPKKGTTNFKTMAQQWGHAVLPLPPPKPSRRQDVWAVAVLSGPDGRYLMVKRPPTGLLAGQWEFPAACVWTSESRVADGQVTIPTIAVDERRKALHALLNDVFTDSEQEQEQIIKLLPRTVFQQKRILHDESIEHIFSHIRHILWMESKEIPAKHYANLPRKWTDGQGREVRWMNDIEMKQVGITSQVKKILKAVGAKQASPNKRRRTK